MNPPAGRRGGNRDRSPPTVWSELGRYGGHGLTIGIATALFAWLGTLLDGRLHTEPLFVLLGAFGGFAAGFYSMMRHLTGAGQSEPEADANRDEDPG